MKSKLILALLLTSSITGKVFSAEASVVNPSQETQIFKSSTKAGVKPVKPNQYYLWIDKKKVLVSDHFHFKKLSDAFKLLGLVESGQELLIDDSRLYDASTVAVVKTKADELIQNRSDKAVEYEDAKEFIIKAHFANLYKQKGPFVTKLDSKIYKDTLIENKDGRIVNTGRKGLINAEATANTTELYQALEECKLGRESLQKQMDELRKDFSQQLSAKNVQLQIADLEREIRELESLLKSKREALSKLDANNPLLKDAAISVATPGSSGSVDLLSFDDVPPLSSNLSATAQQVKAVSAVQKNFRAKKVLKSQLQEAILIKDGEITLEDAIQLLLPNGKMADHIVENDVSMALAEKDNLKVKYPKQIEKIEKACKLIEEKVIANKPQGAPATNAYIPLPRQNGGKGKNGERFGSPRGVNEAPSLFQNSAAGAVAGPDSTQSAS
ncbi:MAG: hypothetical protein C0432_01055 [Candidatus Puniceispirillum sp.]|nr:hypothetical protein [Candidatus Pelagibacter sp.]MBA4282870.1 hypothetical protein [Candidatus Puniceispirillum sp.]